MIYWIIKTEQLLDDGLVTSDIIKQIQEIYIGIEVIDIVSVINSYDIYKKSRHKLEMARLNRLARNVTPYKNSAFMDS